MNTRTNIKMSLGQIEAGHIKKGNYIIMDRRPCKVMNVDIIKTGKHGHMRVTSVGIDILTGKKISDIRAGHKQVYEFQISKNTYQFVMLDDNEITCINKDNHEIKLNVNKETELYNKIIDLATQIQNENKTMNIITKCAPVEISSGNFETEEVVDSVVLSNE